MCRSFSMFSLLTVGALLAAAPAAQAGGPNDFEKLAIFGRCEDGSSCSLVVGSDFDLSCPECAIPTTGSIAARVTLLVQELPADGETECFGDATTTIVTEGELWTWEVSDACKDEGGTVELSATYTKGDTALDPCNVECDGGIGERFPFLCSTFYPRVLESDLPNLESWFKNQDVPAGLAEQILNAYPEQRDLGRRPIVLNATRVSVDDHSAIGDELPTTATYAMIFAFRCEAAGDDCSQVPAPTTSEFPPSAPAPCPPTPTPAAPATPTSPPTPTLVPTTAADAIELFWELPPPRSSGVASGIANAQGWAYSDAGEIVSVELFVDGKKEATLPCCSERGDVAARLLSGFSGVLNWGRFSEGSHSMELVVRDSAGNRRSETRTVKTVKVLKDVNFVRDLDASNSKCEFIGPRTFECAGLDFSNGSCDGVVRFEWTDGRQAFAPTRGCR